MFKLIVYAFLIYLLYRFIVDLIIPASKVSSQVRDRLREMQEQQAAQQRQYQQAQQQQQPSQQKQEKPAEGEYIDFEEVK